MKIRATKLPQEAIGNLRAVPRDLWEPYRVLVAPVYIFLPKNGKFVSVKRPLQCFSGEELEKYKSYENFYLPEFVAQVEPFRKAGESVRALLINLRQRCSLRTDQGPSPVLLPLAQHELDRSVLELVGPLWTARENGNVSVEPFFLCFFASEVCLPFPPERLASAIEKDTELFELALLRASVAVFLALHVGYSNAAMLSRVREKIFDATLNASSGMFPIETESVITLLGRLVFEALPDAETREISAQRFRDILGETGSGGAVSRKLISRLVRVSENFAVKTDHPPSVFGEKGIRDD